MEKLAAEMGGSISSFDFAFGETDLYAIAELPDQVTAAALATAVAASGVGRIETVVLPRPRTSTTRSRSACRSGTRRLTAPRRHRRRPSGHPPGPASGSRLHSSGHVGPHATERRRAHLPVLFVISRNRTAHELRLDEGRPLHPGEVRIVDRRVGAHERRESGHQVVEHAIGEPRSDLTDPTQLAAVDRPHEQCAERVRAAALAGVQPRITHAWVFISLIFRQSGLRRPGR